MTTTTKSPQVLACVNEKKFGKYHNQLDHCPICKKHCFINSTRTQAIRHMYECLGYDTSSTIYESSMRPLPKGDSKQ